MAFQSRNRSIADYYLGCPRRKMKMNPSCSFCITRELLGIHLSDRCYRSVPGTAGTAPSNTSINRLAVPPQLHRCLNRTARPEGEQKRVQERAAEQASEDSIQARLTEGSREASHVRNTKCDGRIPQRRRGKFLLNPHKVIAVYPAIQRTCRAVTADAGVFRLAVAHSRRHMGSVPVTAARACRQRHSVPGCDALHTGPANVGVAERGERNDGAAESKQNKSLYDCNKLAKS